MQSTEYEKYVGKGADLLRGWEVEPWSLEYPKQASFRQWRPKALLRESWVATRSPRDDKGFRHLSTENRVDAKGVPATGGSYCSSINVAEGVLIAKMNFSPASRFGAKLPSTFLQRWSDLAFLQWQACTYQARARGERRTALKYVVQHSILNHETLHVMKEVQARAEKRQAAIHGSVPSTHDSTDDGTNDSARHVGELTDTEDDWQLQGPPEWPGLEFAIYSEEGRALLGTPNGKGVAHLLLQHKWQLGKRKIESVRIWSEANGSQAMMRFEIVSV